MQGVDSTLPFATSGTYGGNTSCVEIVTGGAEYALCDMGTGARERAEDYDVALALLTDLHMPSFAAAPMDPNLSGAYSDRRCLGENLCGAFARDAALANMPAHPKPSSGSRRHSHAPTVRRER